MNKRINPETKKEEFEIHPDGLPAIWVSTDEFCSRCAVYKECLGFQFLSDKEWEEVNHFISETNFNSQEVKLKYKTQKGYKFCNST